MNFAIQKNAPYNYHILEDGVIKYKGNAVSINLIPEQKLFDQSLLTPSSIPTEIG